MPGNNKTIATAPTYGYCQCSRVRFSCCRPRTVAESARGAAFDDSRFPPVTRDHAPELRVSLSVLSPLHPVRPEQVEIGRHGLLISRGYSRGLLLPQVPLEHGWDRIAFLEQTCRKAGLPPNAWQTGAKLEAFTAEIFADPE